jgi:hypothetical protein
MKMCAVIMKNKPTLFSFSPPILGLEHAEKGTMAILGSFACANFDASKI